MTAEAGKPARTQKSKSRGNGEGSVYKRDNGWVAALTVGYAEGKRQVRKKSAPTKTAASALLRGMQNERDAGVLGAGDTTVAELMNDWVTVAAPKRRTRGGQISAKTLSDHGSLIRVHILPRIGRIRLNNLRVHEVEEMFQGMADEGKSQSTISHTRYALSLALDRAVKLGLVSQNVAKLADMPKTDPRPQKKSFTMEQADIFLKAIRGRRYEAAWTVQLHVGLRPGEVLGLLWEDLDLDLETGLLHVRRALHDEIGCPTLGPTKTPKSIRTIKLPELTISALWEHRDRQASERDEASEMWEECGLVFPTSIGLPTGHRAYRRSLQRATRAAGLGDNWTPNELRHSCFSLLSAMGVAMEYLADLAGHTSTRMVSEVYRHRITPSVGVAVAPVEAMFGPPPKTNAA